MPAAPPELWQGRTSLDIAVCPLGTKMFLLTSHSCNSKNSLQILYLRCTCLLSLFSRARFFATLWTVACQAPLTMEFSGREYWSGLPYPSPRDLPDPGIEPASMSPALAGRFFTTSATWGALSYLRFRFSWKLENPQNNDDLSKNRGCFLPYTEVWSTQVLEKDPGSS